MIKVQRLHFELKKRLNRIFSDNERALTAIDVDSYLNQAKEILLENYTAIVEKNRILSDRLRSLEIKNVKLEYISKNNKSYIFKLPSDHYTTLNRYAIGSTAGCNTKSEIFVNNIFTHKIQESLRDPNTSPSFNWRETFSNEDNLGLHIYHNDVLEVDEVYIDYLKWIPDVAYYGGVANKLYINQDGDTITEDLHLMIDDKIIWIKIVDLAEYLVRKNFDENPQITMESILFNEKVYINN
jgi:hypothetical protein